MNIIDMRVHMNFGDAGNAFRNWPPRAAPTTATVTGGPLTAAVSAKGDLRAYVLSRPGNPAPGKVGSDGPYLR